VTYFYKGKIIFAVENGEKKTVRSINVLKKTIHKFIEEKLGKHFSLESVFIILYIILAIIFIINLMVSIF